jgi:hypothetical protein
VSLVSAPGSRRAEHVAEAALESAGRESELAFGLGRRGEVRDADRRRHDLGQVWLADQEVYSDRVQNLLIEKFRNFSGKVRTVAEVRASQDRIEGLEEGLRLYVDAVTQLLDANRGDWGQGMFFTGGYEVKFDPVQHGGRNVLQVAKVIFEVDLSS